MAVWQTLEAPAPAREISRNGGMDAGRKNARPLRILSNTGWFEGRAFNGHPIASTVVGAGGPLTTIRLFLQARRCDAVVFDADERRLLLFCLLRRLSRAKRCRLVSVDIHLAPPRTPRARLRARVVGWLLREVDLFISYFKATERMQRAFGLDGARFVYVPFKVNEDAAVRAIAVTEGGFGLVCGRSDRDYRTLGAAARDLDVPIVVLTGPDHAKHRVDVNGDVMPSNVTVHADDGSAHSWIDWIAKAQFVILPLQPDVIKPSGISTYLVAMALGKCVIITDSAATQGLIDSGQAVLVRPGDALALRDAIAQVASDATYRERVAAAGQAYASALGNEDRLADDVVQRVGTLIDAARD